MLHRLLRDNTQQAMEAAAREAAADEERRRIRAAVRGALQKNVRLARAWARSLLSQTVKDLRPIGECKLYAYMAL